MNIRQAITAAAASAAMVAAGAAPAMAAPAAPFATVQTPLNTSALQWSAQNDSVNGWRGDRGYRGHRGYGYGRGYRNRDRVDAGDVLAGVLIIGGIAAIASAAAKSNRDRDQRYENRRYDNRGYENRGYEDRSYNGQSSDNRYGSNYGGASGTMDSAISTCSNAAEAQAGRDARVEEITAVTRDGSGWRVEGALSNSAERSFVCGSTGGRLDFVQLGNGSFALNGY